MQYIENQPCDRELSHGCGGRDRKRGWRGLGFLEVGFEFD